MPVETLRPSDGRLAGAPFTSAMPLRILNKGPDYFRRVPEPGVRRLSAVERLEADKAKYVKSQRVAHTRQEPIKPPIIRKPLMSPGMLLHTPPARKVPRWPSDSENGGQGPCRATLLNLEILNNLINISDGPQPSPSSPSSLSPSASSDKSAGPQQGVGFRSHFLSKPSSSCTSSPFNSHTQASPLPSAAPEPSHRPPPVPARVSRPAAQNNNSNPNPVTVRRVDVLPQTEIRKPQRMPLKVHPKALQPQSKSRQTAQPQVSPPLPSSFKSSSTPTHSSSPSYPPSSPLVVMLPPSSPACTRLSSASSRGSTRRRPSLHRSKSDLSDRYARANADLERFFNYCGLEPKEIEGMEHFGRANSDIVSISKLRSVSTPSSECGDERHTQYREEVDDDDDDARPSERVPYGISIIERNARVIKWLYGIRQARDTQTASNV
ncbi:protein FAM110B [Trichomycterus rosablanca]|uniref:protein FAM110B n=1 Tax=Trichomycterus rosablanca TaxID=2290929 RepID=UPI002F35989E